MMARSAAGMARYFFGPNSRLNRRRRKARKPWPRVTSEVKPGLRHQYRRRKSTWRYDGNDQPIDIAEKININQ
jgi:hypothetical protein